MASTAITGQDTLRINDRSLVDLGDGDVGNLTYPNDIVGVKTGKNGNSVFAFNETGKQCEMVLRVIRGSADDKYLNSQLASMKNNFPGFVLMSGELVKQVGDGKGTVTKDTYILSGGVITKQVESVSNVEGGTDQAMAIYHLKFTNAPRVLT